MECETESFCPFCYRPKLRAPAARVKSRSSEAIKPFQYLLRRVFGAAERVAAVKQARDLLKSAHTAYVVGTGGSFSSAAYIAQVICKHGREGFAQAIHPIDYIRIGGTADILIVISYSGNTRDCGLAIDEARVRGVRQIVLVTANSKGKLTEKLQSSTDTVINYGSGKPERGFISIAGTVAPCAVWAAAATPWPNIVDLRESSGDNYDISDSLVTQLLDTFKSSCPVIHAFGSGFAKPALIDLESKITEGGLGTIHLHEVKDFSHGRFMRLLSPAILERNPAPKEPCLLFRVAEDDPYETELLRELGQVGPVFTVTSSLKDILGGIHLLIKVQYLIDQVARAANVNLSKPSQIPSAGLRLYRWGT